MICVLQCSIKPRHDKAREDKKRLAAMTEEEVAKQIEESEKHAGLSLSVAAAAAAASLTVCMIDFPFDTKAFQWFGLETNYISVTAWISARNWKLQSKLASGCFEHSHSI